MAETHSIPTDPRFQNLTGMRFGRLLVVEYAGKDKWRKATWLCACDCGRKKVIHGGSLTRNLTASCGCLVFSLPEQTPVKKLSGYASWKSMLQRCYYPKHRHYARYGGAGIQVCEEWKTFANFYRDMGPRPSAKHSIDRIDNSGDYEPGNCRWATHVEQHRNRTDNRLLTFDGRTQPLAAWAEELELNPYTLDARLRRGWPDEEALTTPVDVRFRRACECPVIEAPKPKAP